MPASDPQVGTLPASQKAYWNQCHRTEDLFFIWHRAYLAALERNLRILSGRPDLGVPYWNWYANPVLPAIFRGEFLDTARTVGNPLYDGRRDPSVQAGGAVWSPASSGAIDQSGFWSFQEMLNNSEHGDIHVGIGGSIRGDMGSVPTAARDPIFWLHHCNIDRLMTAWVKHGNTVPDQAASFDGRYKFPIEAQADMLPVAGELDMAAEVPFGAAYESLDAPFTSPPRPVSKPPVTVTRSPSTRQLGNSVFAFNAPSSTSIPAKGLSISFSRPYLQSA